MTRIREYAAPLAAIALALVGYDLLRRISSDDVTTAHVAPHLPFDEWLGGGTIPTVRMQEWLYAQPGVSWHDALAWVVYSTHYVVPVVTGVLLMNLRSPRAGTYLAGAAVLSWMALCTYWLWPAQPPWMTGEAGLHEPLRRTVHDVWQVVAPDQLARIWTPSVEAASETPANTVAALPSLHAAFPLLILLALRGVRRWLTGLLWAYTVAMAVVLVSTGEHFVFDVLVGWLYAVLAAALVAVSAIRRRRAAPRVAPAGYSVAGAAGSGHTTR